MRPTGYMLPAGALCLFSRLRQFNGASARIFHFQQVVIGRSKLVSDPELKNSRIVFKFRFVMRNRFLNLCPPLVQTDVFAEFE